MRKSSLADSDGNHRLIPASKTVLGAALAALAALVAVACSDPESPEAPPPSAPSLVMVSVDGGIFQRSMLMASDLTEVDAFLIGKYEVTQAQYMDVTGKANPSWNRYPNLVAEDTNRPVDKVSWFDAVAFCNLLSMSEGLTPVYSILDSSDPADWGVVPTSELHLGYAAWRAVTADFYADGYRLPTEAEWMWAAMGATEGTGSWDAGVFLDGSRKRFAGDPTPMDDSNTPGDYAWYEPNSESLGSSDAAYGTHAVGTKLPNELALFDMSGNVDEWCWDIYAAYPSGYLDNPTGAPAGDYFVFRGGSWQIPPDYVSVANRSGQQLACNSYTTLGFRVARRP